MTSLNEIAQTVYDQIQPQAGDEVVVEKESVLASARSIYAYNMQLFYWNEKQREGYCEVPAYLLEEKELPVANNEIDISVLDVFNSFGAEQYIVNVGGLTCECTYVKTSVNLSQLLCGYPKIDDNTRQFVIVGEIIKFPEGTHSKKIKVVYAGKGKKIDGQQQVDDAIAGVVREKLLEQYLGKLNKVDETNNSNGNN